MKRIQITLNDEEATVLNKIAAHYGSRLPIFVKFILMKEMAKYLEPADRASYKQIATGELAKERHKTLMNTLIKDNRRLDDLWE